MEQRGVDGGEKGQGTESTEGANKEEKNLLHKLFTIQLLAWLGLGGGGGSALERCII